MTGPGPHECVPDSGGPGLRAPAPTPALPSARRFGMAAAKAEMQLMSPLQISDPFGSFPHSPTMDNYPKLEEMLLLSNGAPQFLGAAGAPEGSGGSSGGSSGGGGGGGGGSGSGSSSSAFNPQGETGDQPYEHLTAESFPDISLNSDKALVETSYPSQTTRLPPSPTPAASRWSPRPTVATPCGPSPSSAWSVAS